MPFSPHPPGGSQRHHKAVTHNGILFGSYRALVHRQRQQNRLKKGKNVVMVFFLITEYLAASYPVKGSYRRIWLLDSQILA